MKNVIDRQPEIILLILLGVVCAGLGGFAYYKYNNDVKKINRDKENVKKEIAVSRGKIDGIPFLEKQIGELKEFEEEFKKMLPTKKEASYVEFVNVLSRFEKQAGVRLNEIKAVSSAPDLQALQLFEKLSYQFKVIGDFFSVSRFINLMEMHKRFMKTQKITFHPMPKTASKNTLEPTECSVDMLVVTYVFKEQLVQ